MINKDIDAITKDDLQSLIDNKYFERRTMDYKLVLPSNRDKDKGEFLADVSSFANTSGGIIVYGMSEEGGYPQEMKGIVIDDIDKEIQRLDNILRDGIEPRITGHTIKPVPLANSKYMVVISIRKGFNSPHRVIFNRDFRFFARNSNGKYQLDVSELRAAFNMSETLADKVKGFRVDRTAKIIANDTPVPFELPAKIIIHLVPLVSFQPAQSYDLQPLAKQQDKLPPMCADHFEVKYNFDGLVSCSYHTAISTVPTYAQFYNNGIIEAVEGLILMDGVLYILDLEEELIKILPKYMDVLKTLTVAPPVYLFLTLVGVKGYPLTYNRLRSAALSGKVIDRDMLIIPEVVIDNYEVKPEKLWKPCFDTIWRACGMARSFNYDENGNWTGGR